MSTEETAKTAEDTIARLMEADKKPRRYLECQSHANRLCLSLKYFKTKRFSGIGAGRESFPGAAAWRWSL